VSVGVHADLGQAILGAFQPDKTHDFKEVEAGLRRQEPVVIVCKIGPWTGGSHAMVATHARFAGTAEDPELISIDVLDPAQKPDGVRTLSAEYIQNNLMAVFSRSVARAILEGEAKTIKVSS
jgi:hypothetical protein